MYWRQRGWWKPAFDLFDGANSIGSLVLRSGWKDAAVATMRSGTVQFVQQNWWRRNFDAIDAATGKVFGSYTGSSWKNDGEFSVGDATFTLNRGFWRQITEVTDASGATLFKIKNADWLGRRQEVILGQGVSLDAITEFLLYFAMFVTVVTIRTESSAAVVTVPS
jgi:hypothetical protein